MRNSGRGGKTEIDRWIAEADSGRGAGGIRLGDAGADKPRIALLPQQRHQLAHFRRARLVDGHLLGVGVDQVGVGDGGFGVGEGCVGLVALDGGEQVAGEQRSGGSAGLVFVFARAEQGHQVAAFGEAVGGGFVDRAQQHRPAPGCGQGDGVGVGGAQVGGAGEDEGGGVDVGGDGLGGGGGGGREEGGYGGYPALGGGDDGRARAHGVAGQDQLVGVHADRAVTEANAGADVEGGEQVGGQADMRRDGAAFGVGGGGDETPGRQVFQ